MLKALELVGFKSFADKTRFDFPPGITVVVGPNGSGKSNVVDAIRWVLGEQSIKNLRGKEMVDVIFNGSASRRPLNSAEATLVFDNSDHRLPVDSAEVAVTRRVYRSGEGEYLLNRQPCRLRDIRDLFSGTGAATEAYSVIEQGKVDILLQSSPRDRRAIFEEAAGISRFKVKKVEALRRLERVEQNLLRLRDIVDEVEGRLNSVRQQAGKARRYKELADRLQQLRIHVGWADWRQFTAKLEASAAEISALQAEIAGAAVEIEAIETRGLSLETEMADIDRLIRTSDSRIAANRERLAALESTIEHERLRVAELEEQSARHRRQAASLGVRTSDVEEQMQATRDAAAAAQSLHQQTAAQLAERQQALAALTARARATPRRNRRPPHGPLGANPCRGRTGQGNRCHRIAIGRNAIALSALHGPASRVGKRTEPCGERSDRTECPPSAVGRSIGGTVGCSHGGAKSVGRSPPPAAIASRRIGALERAAHRGDRTQSHLGRVGKPVGRRRRRREASARDGEGGSDGAARQRAAACWPTC